MTETTDICTAELARNGEFNMRGLSQRLALALIVVASAAAWSHRSQAAALIDVAAYDDGAIEMPLAGLAVPADAASRPALSDSNSTNVLTPSCNITAPESCLRLQDICARLDGSMGAAQNGTQTCIIAFE